MEAVERDGFTQEAVGVQEHEKRGAPEHNKIRLVYRVDKGGEVTSYIHIENYQAEQILKVFRYVQEKNKQVTVNDIYKQLKMSRFVLHRIADRLAGVLWIDIKDGEHSYKRLSGPVIDVRKGMFHKSRNLPRAPKYLRAPYIFVPAST